MAGSLLGVRRPSPWTVLDSTPMGDFRVFSVTALASRRDRDDQQFTFYRIDAGDWVNVVALTRDGRLVMVRQFRHGAARVTLEIPGGMVDEGETPAQAAARELQEETGYAPGRIERIGAVNPNPALFPNTLHTFLALDCDKVAEPEHDPHEETVVELLEPEAVHAAAAAGEVDHALVLAGLYWWERNR